MEQILFRCNLVGLLIGCLLVPHGTVAADAQADSSDTAPANRPRIGLVLGGGGAKGAAHVGVLQVLEEMRIPIDCIAGTSMGALIGATYAAGRQPDEIERSVTGIQWTQTVGGQQNRNRKPIDRKISDVYYSNALEFGLRNGRLSTPAGFIQTQDIEDEIWQLVSAVDTVSDFDELPIPFRAVATDMLSGEMVVLGEGNLPVAMRASMALPAIFSPVNLDGRILADGGMVRNLPVDVGRELCADVVIAVWMSSPPTTAEDVTSALAVFDRSYKLMIGVNQRAQIASLTDTDVGIEVPMGDIETGDFLRVAEAVDLGRKAAENYQDALQELSVSEDEYTAWRKTVGQESVEKFTVAEITVVGNERVDAEYIKTSIRTVQPGVEFSSANLVRAAENVFALGDFDRISYRILGPEDNQTLEFIVSEKPWGPDFFRFDFGLAAQGSGGLQAIIRAEHDRTWINSRGGRWQNAFQFGEQTFLKTDFYQPIDVRQRWFVQPVLVFENNIEDFYLDYERFAKYFVRQLYAQLDFGLNIGTRAQVRLGLRHGHEEAAIDTGPPQLPELDRQRDTSLQFGAVYDTRNSVGLPTRGTLFHLRYVNSEDWFGSELEYSLAEAVISQAFNLRGNSLTYVAGGGVTLDGQLPITQQIQLGGIRTFPGLRPGELRGNEYWFAGTRYAWRLADVQPLFGQAVYAGVRLQAGQVSERFDDVKDGTLYSLALSLGGKVTIGNFLFSLGYVSNGDLRLQFSLGRPVDEGSLLDEID